MRELKTGLLLGALIIASPAAAEDSAKAILTFGLVGAWSENCDTDMSRPCEDIDRCFPRLIFTVPLQGQPTQSVMSPAAVAGSVMRGSTPIASATLMADDRIRITTTGVSETGTATWETVYLKSGPYLRVWSARQINGGRTGARDGYRFEPANDWRPGDPPDKQWRQSTQATPVLRKCAN